MVNFIVTSSVIHLDLLMWSVLLLFTCLLLLKLAIPYNQAGKILDIQTWTSLSHQCICDVHRKLNERQIESKRRINFDFFRLACWLVKAYTWSFSSFASRNRKQWARVLSTLKKLLRCFSSYLILCMWKSQLNKYKCNHCYAIFDSKVQMIKLLQSFSFSTLC